MKITYKMVKPMNVIVRFLMSIILRSPEFFGD